MSQAAAEAPEAPPEEAPALGDMSLFLADDYAVSKVAVTLGGITKDLSPDDSLYGLHVGDEVDLVIRGAKVTGAKSTHQGEVTLILYGEDVERMGPRK